MKYYSITEHSPQCKEPQTLNLEKKKILQISRNKEVLGQTRPRVFSTRNISTELSTPIQNLTRQERSTTWPYQPNTSQESTCSFMHLWKPTHNVTLVPGQGQQIIPKLCWCPKSGAMHKLGSMN